MPDIRLTLLLLNARVLTLDPARPRAGAVAVAGNRIVALGETAELRAMAGPGTRTIDCGERALLSGFHDSHIHLLGHASHLSAADCSPRAAKSIADLQGVLRKRAASVPPGTWIRAVGYDEFSLAEKRHPTRWELDAAAPDHPVWLHHRSYHACVLNSLALRLAGIGMETPEPPGGLIERDLETGEPNGLLFETAQELAHRAVPPLSPEELNQGVAQASQLYLRWGITALQDATASNTLSDWRTFLRMQQEGHLCQRVTLMLGDDGLPQALEAGLPPYHGEGLLRLGPVKIIVDETTGAVYPHPEVLKEQVLMAHRAGFQVALHTLTPETLQAAVDAIEYAQRSHPRPDARHRVEHCSVCPPEMARRLQQLGIYVSTQPGFVYYSGDRYLEQVPADQLPWLYPLRTLEEAGVPVAASSDSPVVPANPFAGLYAAATRRSEGHQAVGFHQAVAVARALRMYTQGSAAAVFQEGALGRIAPGALADLTLLSDDPTAVPPEMLLELSVQLTIVDGQVAWEAP